MGEGCNSVPEFNPSDVAAAEYIEREFIDFFIDNNGNLEASPFNYEILPKKIDTPRTLIITAPNGDQAIYYMVTLSTRKFSNTSFSIYPNPVVDELSISSSENLKNYKVEIFDLLGKLKLSKVIADSNSINVESLTSGMYILLITDDLGNSSTKKFVK